MSQPTLFLGQTARVNPDGTLDLNRANLINATGITADSFTGTASNTSGINTISDNSNTSCYIPFTKSTAGTSRPLYVDDTTGPLTYNPSTSTLSVSQISQPSGINIAGGAYTWSQTSPSNLRLYTFQQNGTIELYAGGSFSNLQLTAFGSSSFVNIYGNGSGAGVNIYSNDGNTNFIGTGNVVCNRPFSATNNITSSSTSNGYVSNPVITLTNSSINSGFNLGVPSLKYDKTGRNAVAGDCIGSTHYFAKNYLGNSTEFAKVEASVRNTGSGNDDGSIAFSGLINGTMTEFLRINGADSENNMFLPVDMNGQSIKSSSGDLNLTTYSSTGSGNITLTPKPTGGYLILSNIPSSNVGLPTGAIWRDASTGGTLKMV